MMKLQVSGMTCGGCARSITRAIEALPLVERALVDLKTGEVTVEGTADEQAVRQAVEEAGFEVRGTA